MVGMERSVGVGVGVDVVDVVDVEKMEEFEGMK